MEEYMDYTTILSTAIGVVLGGVLTWLFSWYYARQADRKLDKVVVDLMNQIPEKSASKVVSNNLFNAILSASPLIIRIISKMAENSEPVGSDKPQDQMDPDKNSVNS
ncbi:hypothetical protein [Algoriphagus sp. NG3]|uniref:hypothetical protein n=1 Tax=Algoriphagus sp. NG3 TaxID=3097546 RepID=UPI002A83CD09|nr:hypothetical protein [Algoriphagus sp. NG3]WPR77724.1 hypothetical protein SLW71_10250 [Algoriphagus sp. NG3]